MKKLIKTAAYLALCLAALLTFAAGFALAAEVSIPIKVTVEGVEYTLPCPVKTFLDNGWAFETEGFEGRNYTKTLKALEDVSMLNMVKGGKRIEVDIKNEHYAVRNIEDGTVYEIETNNYDATASVLWEGIGVGTPSQQLLDKLSDDIFPENVSDTYIYYQNLAQNNNYEYSISATRENAGGEIRTFWVSGEYHTPSAEILAERDAMPVYRPASFSEYVAPTSLGDDPLSGVIELKGKLYRLPIPIEQLANDGWMIPDDEWVSPDEEKHMTFTHTDDEYAFLGMYARNPMEAGESVNGMPSVPAKAIYCETAHLYDYNDKDFWRLPGGIRCGMLEEDILPALRPYAQAEKNKNYYPDDFADSEYVAKKYDSTGENVVMELSLDVKDGKVVAMSIEMPSR